MDAVTIVAVGSGAFFVISLLLYQVGVSPRASTGSNAVAESAEPETRSFFWPALGVRIAAAALIAMAGASDFLAPDQAVYEEYGRAIARVWTHGNGISILEAGEQSRIVPYHYYNAATFYFFGPFGTVVLHLLNALAGAASVAVVHRIATLIYGGEVARYASFLVAFMPSLVLWSALNIRDAWAVLAILLTVLAAIYLRERNTFPAALGLLVSMALLGLVRGYMFVVIGVGVLVGYVSALGGSIIKNYTAAIIASIIFVYLYTSQGYGAELIETISFEKLNEHRANMASGGSAFYADVDISTPSRALAYLPIGVAFFLLAPFPWDLAGIRQLMTLPEMLIWWYLAFRYVVPGLREAIRIRPHFAMTLLSVIALAIIAYGLVEGNVGTAYRHRAQVLPLLLIFAAGGLANARSRRRASPAAISVS